ncbi:TPA: hypothetical protein ACUZAU_004716, partial [Salmonella enterica]
GDGKESRKRDGRRKGKPAAMLPGRPGTLSEGRHQIDDIKDIYQLIFGPMSSNRNLILMLVVIPPHHSQMAGILIHFLDV